MRKIKMLALATALVAGALASRTTAAETTCEANCRADYGRCQVICSKNPCFVSCETVLNACLGNCGSAS
ncbi:MAG: hypothetical protein ACJ75H_20625 [Thermoanaerobaculia bacterium]